MSESVRLNRKTKILSTLTQDGASTALQISDRASIPINKTYGLLAELTREGLVLSEPYLYRGTVYSINKPSFLGWLKKECQKHDETSRLLHEIEKRVTTSPRMPLYQLSPEIWAGSAEGALPRTIDLFRQARKNIKVSTFIFSWYNGVKPVLIEKLHQGVKVQVLTSSNTTPYLKNEEGRIFETRKAELEDCGAEVFTSDMFVPFRGSIVDQRVATVMMFSFHKPSKVKVTDQYCIFTNKAVVATLLDYFNLCVTRARTTKRRQASPSMGTPV